MRIAHTRPQRPQSDAEKKVVDRIAAPGGQRRGADAAVPVAATGEPVGGDQAANARRMAYDAGGIHVAAPAGCHQVEDDGEPGRRRAQLCWGSAMLLRRPIREHLSAVDHRRRRGTCGAGIAHRAVEGWAATGQPGRPDSGPSGAGDRGGPRSVSVAAGAGPAEPADLLVSGGGVSSGNPGTAGVGGYAAGKTVFVPHTSANRGSAPGHQGWIAASADHVALALVRYHVADRVDDAECIVGGCVRAAHCVDRVAVRMAALEDRGDDARQPGWNRRARGHAGGAAGAIRGTVGAGVRGWPGVSDHPYRRRIAERTAGNGAGPRPAALLAADDGEHVASD